MATLVLLRAEDDSLIEEVTLEDSVLDRLEAAAEAAGVSLEAFVLQVLREQFFKD